MIFFFKKKEGFLDRELLRGVEVFIKVRLIFCLGQKFKKSLKKWPDRGKWASKKPKKACSKKCDRKKVKSRQDLKNLRMILISESTPQNRDLEKSKPDLSKIINLVLKSTTISKSQP